MRAYLMLVAMGIFWGGTWVAAKVAVGSMPPMVVAAGRFGIASLLLWAWTRTQPRPPPVTRADLPLILVMGVSGVAGYNALFLYGLRLAPASDGAIIVPGLSPVLTALVASRLLGERLALSAVLGFVIAFAGLVLVMSPTGATTSDRFIGDVMFFAGAVCWAVYSIIGKKATARFTSTFATLYATIAGTILLLPLALLEAPRMPIDRWTTGAWLGVLYLAVLGTVIPYVFFYEGMKRIGAARASAFFYLVPIVGVITTVLFLGERLAPATAIGAVCVLTGLWVIQRPTKSKAQ